MLVGTNGLFPSVRQAVQLGVQANYLGDIVWRGVVNDDAFCVDGNFKICLCSRGIYANFFDLGCGKIHWGLFIEKEQMPSGVGRACPWDVTMPTPELVSQDA